jgi:hypothetical protein
MVADKHCFDIDAFIAAVLCLSGWEVGDPSPSTPCYDGKDPELPPGTCERQPPPPPAGQDSRRRKAATTSSRSRQGPLSLLLPDWLALPEGLLVALAVLLVLPSLFRIQSALKDWLSGGRHRPQGRPRYARPGG